MLNSTHSRCGIFVEHCGSWRWLYWWIEIWRQHQGRSNTTWPNGDDWILQTISSRFL